MSNGAAMMSALSSNVLNSNLGRLIFFKKEQNEFKVDQSINCDPFNHSPFWFDQDSLNSNINAISFRFGHPKNFKML